MEAIFKNGDVVYETQFFITSQKDDEGIRHYHTYIQDLLSRHDKVFGQIPRGDLLRGFEHTIELEEGDKPVITTPYKNPKKFKDEIEK
jgi:hypothetical protein